MYWGRRGNEGGREGGREGRGKGKRTALDPTGGEAWHLKGPLRGFAFAVVVRVVKACCEMHAV